LKIVEFEVSEIIRHRRLNVERVEVHYNDRDAFCHFARVDHYLAGNGSAQVKLSIRAANERERQKDRGQQKTHGFHTQSPVQFFLMPEL